jgi:surface polysaccharide O-acyltransferase-like enzyme
MSYDFVAAPQSTPSPTEVASEPYANVRPRPDRPEPFRHLQPLPAQPDPARIRNQSVDFVRVLAVLAVIVIHIAPFTRDHVHVGFDFNAGVAVNQFARFAVPFFFVISGYFWASQIEPGVSLLQPSLRTAKRVALLFLTWSALYLLPTNVWEAVHSGPLGLITTFMSNLRQVVDHPEKLIFEGTKVHLWFLVGLLWSLAISAVLISNRMPRTLAALAIALYLIGLSGKAYSDTPFGFHSQFNFRDGPFFGLIFFASGYFMQRRGPRPSWLMYGILLIVAGFAVHFTELVLLKHFWGTSTMQDYLLGTYFVGIGVAMTAFVNPRFLQIPWLSAIGPMVVGIYVVHFAFIELLQPLDRLFSEQLWWGIAYPLAVFMLSLAAVAAISGTRLKRLVR